jgi:ferredoxin
MLKTAVRSRPNTTAVVERELCCYCGACVAVCPPQAILLLDAHLQIDDEACTSCGRCVRVCPVHALSMAGRPR